MSAPRLAPVYVVIGELAYNYGGSPNYSVEHIVGVFACDLSDIDQIYREQVWPLYSGSRSIQVRLYTREPSSPFRVLGAREPDEAIRGLVVEALSTDGAHHKQWYLYELAKALNIDIDSLVDRRDLAPGIAP